MKMTLTFAVGFLSAMALGAMTEEVPRAFSISKANLNGGMYDDVEASYNDYLKGMLKGVDSYETADGRFEMGGMELVMDENTPRERRYDGFPRNELMYFSAGGMKLVEDDGTVVEAGPGEMLFIPLGWKGIRIFTGETALQKFSVVYE